MAYLSKEKMREYYLEGLWEINRVNALLAGGRISQEDYNYIISSEDDGSQES